MKDIPVWALTLFYWLHMLGTVLWVGGMVTANWLVGPPAWKILDPVTYRRLMGSIQRRLLNMGWFSLLLLGGTGLMQLAANPHYSGFLVITNLWAVAILIKHLAYGVMVLITAYLTWGLNPALNRAVLVHEKTEDPARRELAAHSVQALQRRETYLLRANLALGVIILGLTALARSA